LFSVIEKNLAVLGPHTKKEKHSISCHSGFLQKSTLITISLKT
jgi:hypothetical protein